MRQIRTKDVPRCERRKYKERCIAEHNRKYFLAPLHAEALRMDRLWMEQNRPEIVAAEMAKKAEAEKIINYCKYCAGIK